MAISATMSLLGLYEYDNTLFDLLQIPEALDKEILVDNILMDAASLEVLYPDPDFLKAAIGKWSARRLHVWEELQATTEYDYNPIDNYDRYETSTDTETGTGTDSVDTSSSGSTTGTGTAQSSGDSTATSAATAYNSDSFKDTGKSTTTTGNESSSETSMETSDQSSSDRTYNNTVQRQHTAHLHGNIGVTTTMQMIREQRDVVLFNLYDVIASELINKFCIGVY